MFQYGVDLPASVFFSRFPTFPRDIIFISVTKIEKHEEWTWRPTHGISH